MLVEDTCNLLKMTNALEQASVTGDMAQYNG